MTLRDTEDIHGLRIETLLRQAKDAAFLPQCRKGHTRGMPVWRHSMPQRTHARLTHLSFVLVKSGLQRLHVFFMPELHVGGRRSTHLVRREHMCV